MALATTDHRRVKSSSQNQREVGFLLADALTATNLAAERSSHNRSQNWGLPYQSLLNLGHPELT